MTGLMLLALAAAPVVTVAVPGFNGSGITREELSALEQRFVILAQTPGVHFITAQDIGALMGVERQKQLLGCASGDCLAEISNALGADIVLSGTVSKLGDELVFNLRALRVNTGADVYNGSKRFKDVASMIDWAESEAPTVGRALAGRSGPSALRFTPVILGGAGLAAMVVGGVLYGESKGDASTLRNRTGGDYAAIASQGSTFEKAGAGLLIGGGVLLATGIVLWVTGATSEPSVAFVPMPGGAAFAFGGRF